MLLCVKVDNNKWITFLFLAYPSGGKAGSGNTASSADDNANKVQYGKGGQDGSPHNGEADSAGDEQRRNSLREYLPGVFYGLQCKSYL
jgi:hypothetical protein